ncbi:MAG TPA: hypothetical protein VK427_23330 [Kofleriaceae bacterium]|nr:hypothetical protein [Kofleriaceae bacterium]
MHRLAILVLVFACSKPDRGTPGAERGGCRTGSSAACEPGLLCLSNICVRPPPADCAAVGETLASLDLGNYAEPEERAPVVAKYKAACAAANVSKEQGACLDNAADKWSAAQCAPHMFPELASTDTRNCSPVVERLETMLKGQVKGLDAPQMKQWLDTTLRVMRESCEQDAWPDAVKQCILAAPASPDGDALQTCNTQFPPALQAKLQARLQTAIK